MNDSRSEAGKYFFKQLKFSAGHQRYRDCPYYPCHRLPEGQDGLNCFFCYCPFYPCAIEERGGKWLETESGKVWDCSDCVLVHRDDVYLRILDLIYQGLSIKEIDSIIQSEYY